MITKIYLVRHTQTIGNVERRLTGRSDYQVTEEGKKYTDLLTQRLKSVKFDKAYSSTSGRTKKTIELLARMNDLEIIQSDELCEMYFGIYDGMKWEDVNRINSKIHEDHITTNEIMGIPEQELTDEVADRMYEYIRGISSENTGKTILVASHGVAIEAFLRKITGEPFVEKVEEYSQKNTSVNIIEYNNELNKFKVVLLNDFSHLKEK